MTRRRLRLALWTIVAALTLVPLLAPACAAAVEIPIGRWYVRAYNVDDQSKVIVNGTQVTPTLSYKGDSGWIDITSQVQAQGLDTTIRCYAYNKGGGYAWGYQLGRVLPGSTIRTVEWEQSAGSAGVSGANNNDQSKPNRVVYDATRRLGNMLGLDGNSVGGSWYVRAYNVDDQSKIFVNGSQVTPTLAFKGDSGWVNVTSQVAAKGLDTTIRCYAYNKGGGYAWGYQVGRVLPGASVRTVAWQQRQGTVGVTGANNNDQSKPNRAVYDSTRRLGTMLGRDGAGTGGAWYVRAYNVDDQSKILVNGGQVTPLVGYKGDSGWVNISNQVAAKGLDTSIRCWAYNLGGAYTWGYQLGRALPGASTVSVVWQRQAGTAGVVGANLNDLSKPNRLVYDETFRLGTMKGWTPQDLPVVAPASGDYHYYSQNPFYTGGWGMPNCTCYAWGREFVLRGTPLPLGSGYEFRGNAKDWWTTTQPKGQTPIVGAIAVWGSTNNSGGHVAVVEAIQGSNVIVSESAYQGFFFRYGHTVADSTTATRPFLGYVYPW